MTQKSSYFLFALLLLFGVRSEAQKVTNVHAEQNGNKLEIYYNITQSNSTDTAYLFIHLNLYHYHTRTALENAVDQQTNHSSQHSDLASSHDAT